MNTYWKWASVGCGLLLLAVAAGAQQQTLSLAEALKLVETSQPQLKAYALQTQAAQYSEQLERNTLVPEVTAGYQAGYATYNNITGMSYPGLLLPISGPPSSGNIYDPVPGTALMAMIRWNPLTFGQREAAARRAAAQYKMAASYYSDALFRQQYLTITTYLDALYLQQLMQSSRANISRTEAGQEQSLVLARQGLRPGIDTTQFQAALAQARTELLVLQQQYYAQLTELSRLGNLSISPDQLVLSDTLLLGRLPSSPDTTNTLNNHPHFRYYTARKDVSAAALKEIQHSWLPRLDLWANAYARGSGIAADGSIDKPAGWSLQRNNYGAGLQVSFPILGFARTNLQKKQYRFLLKADEAQLEQTTLDLRQQQRTAWFNYHQNLEIVRQSAIQTKAASFAFDGLKLGYANGLTDFTRLTQGQYDLQKAEASGYRASLQLWRALLEVAVAQGRLEIFTDNMK
ncbi:MAG TPA: TolC family protein [Chitinophaga sp.]|uniref:TolC family protein n=1 Tax=Chitinophaga sp. TaxID=1869181 RepID=UPI002B7C3AB2|nr:TolC family protein [Chitinophaga sp.]HVI45747.1 TolC family protein [Chitinophaga sp.]